MKRRVKKIMSSKVAWIFVVIILLFMLTSAKKVPVSELENYEALLIKKGYATQQVLKNVTEQYFEYEMVPYGEMECVDESFNHTEELIMEKWVAELDDFGDMDHFMKCSIKVTNLENKAGTWQYSMTFHRPSSSIDKNSDSESIGPGETYTFMWRHLQMDITHCTPVREEIPTIERCRYPESNPKRREKVIKERTVEKLVTEQVPSNETSLISGQVATSDVVFINRVFGYQQFFYLGY